MAKDAPSTAYWHKGFLSQCISWLWLNGLSGWLWKECFLCAGFKATSQAQTLPNLGNPQEHDGQQDRDWSWQNKADSGFWLKKKKNSCLYTQLIKLHIRLLWTKWTDVFLRTRRWYPIITPRRHTAWTLPNGHVSGTKKKIYIYDLFLQLRVIKTF